MVSLRTLLALPALFCMTLASAVNSEISQERILAIPYQPGLGRELYYEAVGNALGAAVVSAQIFCYVILFMDIGSRFLFKIPLKFTGAIRTIVILFALVVPWYIGFDRLYANSGPVLHKTLGQWFSYCYHIPYNAVVPGLLHGVRDDDGNRPNGFTPQYFQYINVLLYPLIYFYPIYITKKVVEFSGFIKDGAPWANFIGNLEWITAWAFGFPFAGWAILWFKQIFEIFKYNKNNDPNINMWYFNYLLGWIVAPMTFIIINWDGVIGIWFVASDYMNSGGKNNNRSKN